jgi:hypothetical protein
MTAVERKIEKAVLNKVEGFMAIGNANREDTKGTED